jgi:hypothetical protein
MGGGSDRRLRLKWKCRFRTGREAGSPNVALRSANGKHWHAADGQRDCAADRIHGASYCAWIESDQSQRQHYATCQSIESERRYYTASLDQSE